MQILKIVARSLFALVFIFSGFVKIIDPYGTAYKFNDYFVAMGLPWMQPLSLALALLMNAAELGIGLLMLFNVKTRWTVWAALGFMLLFTPLTLWIALTDAVHDCGCFGDAVKLDNWDTFFKNLVLLALAALLFIRRDDFKPLVSERTDSYLFAGAAAALLGFSAYNTTRLPLIDFRPYKVGVDIRQAMTPPPGAQPDVYETILIYEKDGKQQEFTLENFPQGDDGWTFVDSRNTLVKKGFELPVAFQDLTIESIEDEAVSGYPQGENVLEQMLREPGFTFWMVSYDFDKAKLDALREANALARYCRENGHRFHALSAESLEDVEDLRAMAKLEYAFFFTDEIPLKTMVRSNPGFILLKEGVIVGKWHHRHLPSIEELQEQYGL